MVHASLTGPRRSNEEAANNKSRGYDIYIHTGCHLYLEVYRFQLGGIAADEATINGGALPDEP